MPPVITSSVPATQRRGESVGIKITGTGFAFGMQLFIDSEVPTELLQINHISSTEIHAVVPPTLSRGFFNLRIVDTVNDVEAILENALVVVPTSPVPPFSEESFQNIITRMLNKMPSEFDRTEGGTFWDLFAPISIELERFYGGLNFFLQQAMIDTSQGSYLELLALSHGLSRRQPTKATGTVTFTGTSALVVPKNTRVANVASPGQTTKIFVTDENVTLEDQGGGVFQTNVTVTAVIEGKSHNLAASQVTFIMDKLAGLTGVINSQAITGGLDLELDGPLRARTIRHVREPSHGGNKADYISWVLEDPDVGSVAVEPLWNGNGTVRVLILDHDNNLPTQTVIDRVQDLIDPTLGQGEGRSPIGASVTVAAPTTVTITVVVIVVISSGSVAGEVAEDVEDNIEEFLLNLGIGQNVRFFELADIIMSTVGVNTITSLTVNGGTVDITIEQNEKAVSGSHTINT